MNGVKMDAKKRFVHVRSGGRKKKPGIKYEKYHDVVPAINPCTGGLERRPADAFPVVPRRPEIKTCKPLSYLSPFVRPVDVEMWGGDSRTGNDPGFTEIDLRGTKGQCDAVRR